MPAIPGPVADERAGLAAFVAQQFTNLRCAACGLTDDQARLTPCRSALSVGGLIKHVTSVQKGWVDMVVAAPESPPADGRDSAEQAADYGDDFTVREDESLDDVLAAFAAQAGATLEVIKVADLDAAVPVPDEPWYPKDVDAWSVRWVLLHLIEEVARHAGHADIVREEIDGATTYELVAAVEGWPETPWLKPWRPAAML